MDTSLAKHFEEVSEKIKVYGKDLDNNGKLKLYGLYKQATVGDNNTSQPWAVQMEARAKWEAWTANKGMSKEKAKEEYVKFALEHFPDDQKSKYVA